MENNILHIIESENWRFAVSYANTHPHEYIVRERCSSVGNFDVLCEYIKKNGHYEYFFNKRGLYCSIGAYTYWIMENVINRRWNDMYYLTPNKQIVKVDNWREMLEDGRVLHR